MKRITRFLVVVLVINAVLPAYAANHRSIAAEALRAALVRERERPVPVTTDVGAIVTVDGVAPPSRSGAELFGRADLFPPAPARFDLSAVHGPEPAAVLTDGWTMPGVTAPVFAEDEQLRLKLATPQSGGGAVCDADHLANCRLLTSADLTLDGGFCLPDGSSNGHNPEFSPQTGIAYNPYDNTIFMSGGSQASKYVAEVNIPALVYSSNPLAMNKGTYTARGGFVEPSEGAYAGAFDDEYTAENAVVSGLHVYSPTQLLFSTQYYYDPPPHQVKNYALRPLDLSDTGHVVGFDNFPGVNDASGIGTIRMTTMFSGAVPAEWQAALGGSVIAGAGASYSVIENQSRGPSVGIINPSVMGTGATHYWKPLVFYPAGHTTLGAWDQIPPGSEFYNFATAIRGGAMIGGTRSMLFFGSTGTDNFCYGPGLSDPDDPRIGTPYPDPVTGPHAWCYDPTSTASGNHGYPYAYQIWAYDMLDFVAVVNGTKHAWEVVPYAAWTPSFPVPIDQTVLQQVIRGASMDNTDSTNGKLWISQGSSYGAGCNNGTDVVWRLSINRTPTP